MIFLKILNRPTIRKHNNTLAYIRQLNNATYLKYDVFWVLIYFLYATNPPLRLVKVLSNQNSRWQLSFALSTYKRQEILVFPISWFPDTREDDRCNAALVQQLVSLRDWHGRKTQTEHKDHHYSGWKEVLLWWWDPLHKTQMHEIQNKDYYHNKNF